MTVLSWGLKWQINTIRQIKSWRSRKVKKAKPPGKTKHYKVGVAVWMGYLRHSPTFWAPDPQLGLFGRCCWTSRRFIPGSRFWESHSLPVHSLHHMCNWRCVFSASWLTASHHDLLPWWTQILLELWVQINSFWSVLLFVCFVFVFIIAT